MTKNIVILHVNRTLTQKLFNDTYFWSQSYLCMAFYIQCIFSTILQKVTFTVPNEIIHSCNSWNSHKMKPPTLTHNHCQTIHKDGHIYWWKKNKFVDLMFRSVMKKTVVKQSAVKTLLDNRNSQCLDLLKIYNQKMSMKILNDKSKWIKIQNITFFIVQPWWG